MATHRERNRLLQCLGGIQAPQPDPAVEGGRLAKGDILLLCSDGFWGPLTQRQHAATPARPALAAPELAEARTGGHSDNVSVLAMTWNEEAASEDRTPAARRYRDQGSYRHRPGLSAHDRRGRREGDQRAEAACARTRRNEALGRKPTSCARCASRAASPSMPKARCWSSSATRKVLCTASVEEQVPPAQARQRRGLGHGRVRHAAARHHTRSDREAARGKQSGRTQEIQRLIGRSLRAVFDLAALGERTMHLDCDVLQADGGTRTAAITGAFVAAHDAVAWLLAKGKLAELADQRPRRRDLGRHRRGHAAARPRIHRGLGLRHRHERRHDRRRAASSKCRAPPKARRSRAPRWTRCSASPQKGIARADRAAEAAAARC